MATGEDAGSGGTDTGSDTGDEPSPTTPDQTDGPDPPDPPEPDLPSESVCGDGILSEGEDCDDGNQIDGDGCDADCQADCVQLRSMTTFAHDLEGPDVLDLAVDDDVLAVLYSDANGDGAVSLRSLTGAILWSQVAIPSPVFWVAPAGDIAFVNRDVVATAGAGEVPNDVRGWVTRLSPAGELLSEAAFGSASGSKASVALAPTPDGGVVALGGRWAPDANVTEGVLWGVQIDQTGELEWEMPAPAAGADVVHGAATAASVGLDGRVYTLVRDVEFDTSSTRLVALGPDGTVWWSKEAGWTGWAGDGFKPLDLVTTWDGGVCIVSWSDQLDGNSATGALHHECLDDGGGERWQTELPWSQEYIEPHWLTQGRIRIGEQVELVSVVTPPNLPPYDPDQPAAPPSILVQQHGLGGASLCTQIFMFGDHDTMDVLDIRLIETTVLVAGIATGAAPSELFVASLEFDP
jgi:cysteine-rich repeat protein